MGVLHYNTPVKLRVAAQTLAQDWGVGLLAEGMLE